MFSGPSKPFCTSLIAFSPSLSFLKDVQKVMRKGEEEVLRKTLVVRATDWETADFNTLLSLCNCILGERALIICWGAGLGSCSLLHQIRMFCGKDWSSSLHKRVLSSICPDSSGPDKGFGIYVP